jgi:glycosyltransferase involved in cell wall biosynthesis
MAGDCAPEGAHGSAVKLAHAMAALGANAYRKSARNVNPLLETTLRALFDDDADDANARHAEIQSASREVVRLLGSRAREGGIGVTGLSSLGPRLAALAYAGALEVPYLASTHHHRGARADVRSIEKAFFGTREEPHEPRALVFTDTFAEANGVAGTMRRLAAEGAAGRLALTVATASSEAVEGKQGLIPLPTDWSMQLPAYEEHLALRFPLITDVLERVEAAAPDVVHVATPGPIGVTGLVAAKLLGLPVVGSYHTELGPYALQLTRDAVIAELTSHWVDFFYRQCDLVLAPTLGVMAALTARGAGRRVLVWGRGVDTEVFAPSRADDALRAELVGDGNLLLLSVGRISDEKRLDVLLDAFARVRMTLPGARLAVVGDGPARERLESEGREHVRFLGEVRGPGLAGLYAAADVFCFPSTTDTFGQVLLEAAASGLPTVSVAAGGGAELVEDGITGLVVPPENPAAFALALLRLGGSESLRRTFGVNARERALARTWESSWAELRDAYRFAVHGPVRHTERKAA